MHNRDDAPGFAVRVNPWEIVRENSSYDVPPQLPAGVRAAVLRVVHALRRDAGCRAFFAPPTRGSWRPLPLDLAVLGARVEHGFFRRVEALQHDLARLRDTVARGGFADAPADRTAAVLAALDRLAAQCDGRFAALQRRQDAHSAAAVSHRLAARRPRAAAHAHAHADSDDADAVYRDDFLLFESDASSGSSDAPDRRRARSGGRRRRAAAAAAADEDEDDDDDEEEEEAPQQARRYSTRGTRRKPARFGDDYVDMDEDDEEDEEEEEEEERQEGVVLRLRLGRESVAPPPPPLHITLTPVHDSDDENDEAAAETARKRRRHGESGDDGDEDSSSRDVRLIVHEDDQDDECVPAAPERVPRRQSREVAELVRAAAALGGRGTARPHRRAARWDAATETAVSRQGAPAAVGTLLPRTRRAPHIARTADAAAAGAAGGHVGDAAPTPRRTRETRRASMVWTSAEMEDAAGDSDGMHLRARRVPQQHPQHPQSSRYNLR